MHVIRAAIWTLLFGCLSAAAPIGARAGEDMPTGPAPAPIEAVAPDSPAQAAADKLARAMRDRLRLMPNVARWKWNAGRPVADPPREKALAAQLLQQALKQGLPEELAQRFIAAQMAASRRLQAGLIAQWQAESAGKFENVPDLNEKLRPQIDCRSKALLAALAETAPRLREDEFRELLSRRAEALLQGEGIDDEVRAAALDW